MTKPSAKRQEQRDGHRPPATAAGKRRNAREPQVMPPQSVEVPLAQNSADEVRVPAGIAGTLMGSGSL